MATRMDTERPVGAEDRGRPKVWPWVLLAAVVAIVLWWAAAANRPADQAGYNNTTTPYGVSPGTGTTGAPDLGTGTGTGLGGTGTPGTGDVGGVGTPSPSPTAPVAPR